MTNLQRSIIPACLVLAVACGGSDRPPTPSDSSAAASEGAQPDTVTFPDGFRATVFADSLGRARHLVVRPNGDVYVNSLPPEDSSKAPPGGFVIALRDTNADGSADRIERFAKAGGTGIGLFKEWLYVESGPAIVRYRLREGDLAPRGAPETIVSGLPKEGNHPEHPFVIDSQGNLFVNSGSATNACQEQDRMAGSMGLRPCKELETRAGIWRFSATKTGQRFGPEARYATGIRNAMGLAVNPVDGSLWATQHGRDQLAENWPKLYDWKRSAELPAEELLLIVKDGDYGWPYCYYDPEAGKLVLGPEYGGDGKQTGECAEKLEPAAAYPAHWAPNALTFYRGDAFPERYRQGAFIAFHGSWNRAPEPQAGYNVVFQPFSEGKPAGDYEIFADGFAGERKDPGNARHRPTGLAVGPEGALYISDDAGGRLWRVVYGGSGQ